MESPSICGAREATPAATEEEKGKENRISEAVDQFLLEAIENPRHRLTVLRMELDIQRFMCNSNQHQFEFQHFPTSYLRCAAHRVAQHYGLQTLSLDHAVYGLGCRIVARKTADSKFPAILLLDIPMKQQPEISNSEQLKIAIRPRNGKALMVDSAQLGSKATTVRTVEEREEEYDKARARIFSGSLRTELGPLLTSSVDDKSGICQGSQRSVIDNNEKTIDNNEKTSVKDGASRVAIFRDREKDMTDPDYNRSYNRYVKGVVPSSNFNLTPCNVLQSSPMQFPEGFSHLGQLPGAQPLVSYQVPDPAMNTFCAVGCNQTPLDAVYMQWPAPAIMYAQTYEHIRRANFQAPPLYQQPLSFECWQNN